ncbi:MFS transporter [Agriterribacter sp.]|uniref:MFS transporter n=1 Tax=Agriterribacter sp. TaxID=2821509 RepID=UPI002B805787|nr:MFS transporter [Agriterribacter sp.]HRO45564.1 MFS transporter [Agriterribacter sp.]HRQ17240.1 MFS transporter [Agriterribacter sp.]
MKNGIANNEAQKITAYLWVLFGVCFISSAFGGTVSTLMSVYLPVVIKDVQLSSDTGEHARISAYINAVFIFGWAIGGFAWGVISDRIGRKKALLLAIGCYAVFTILTGMLPNWWSIVLCRVLSGFGVGGVLVIGFTFISEVWPSKSKAVFMGILSIAFPVGIFSAGLINYMVSSWQQAFLSGFVPLILAIAGIWIIKESANWKTSKQQILQNNNPAESLFSPAFRKDLLIGSVTFGSMLIGLWAIFSWLPTWVQSLITDSNGQKERGLTMMLLGMGGLTGGFFSGWFLNAVGTRKAMLMCFAVCSVLSFVLFKTNTVFTPLVYIETGILAFFFGISQGVLSYYIPQLFPTGIRATATGFCFNIGRLFTGTAVLFVGILVTVLGGYGNAIYLFSLVFIVGLLVVLLIRKMEHKLV